MFKRIREAIFSKANRRRNSAGKHLAQAQLSHDLVQSLQEAIDNDYKVYFRVDVEGSVHAFCVPGKNNPMVENIRDFMDAAANEMLRQASRAELAERLGNSQDGRGKK